jgi:hypothetical protein
VACFQVLKYNYLTVIKKYWQLLTFTIIYSIINFYTSNMISLTPCYQLHNTLLIHRTAGNSPMYSPVKFISLVGSVIRYILFFLTYWAKNVVETKTWCQESKKLVHIKCFETVNFEHKWKENDHCDHIAIQECKHKHHKCSG